jgi:hypothetical protein
LSDIGLSFSPWFIVGLALMIALPVTTAIVAGLGAAAYRIRRRDPTRRLTGLKWGAIIVAPLWLVGLGFGGSLLVSDILKHIANAQHDFTLDTAATVDGIALPAGTRVELDDTKALATAELPDGATLALRRATWRGKVDFTAPAHAPNAAHGLITEGTLATTTAIEGIPCRAGSRVTFFWGGELAECTLAQDADASATIDKPDGSSSAQRFRCLAGDTINMAGLRQGEVEECRLAEAADFGEVACAAGERVQVTNGNLYACTLAKPSHLGALSLPAGTSITYYERHPSNFKLPSQSAPVDGFGLSLPAGTEGYLCYPAGTLDRLTVSRNAYVAIEGIKLTGSIDFDCGTFRDGTLFEDTMIGSRWRQRGDLLSRQDLFPQKGG